MISCLEARAAWQECFDEDGVAILDGVLTHDEIAEWIGLTRSCSVNAGAGTLDRGGEVYGMRDLLWRIPETRRLAESAKLLKIVEAILGPKAFAVRGLILHASASGTREGHRRVIHLEYAAESLPDGLGWYGR